VINILRSFRNFVTIFVLNSMGATISYDCIFGKNVTLKLGISQSKKGIINVNEKTEICNGVNLECWGGSIDVSENVFIGPYTVIYGHGGVKIGKDSLIAMHCRILSSNHTFSSRDIKIRSQPNIFLPVSIGEDVWLGAGVTVLGGVTIGDGCVVGAGSVVTKDLPPYSIAVGIPAEIIKTRI
jgi:acetyltransferase-like isoleucine patch superfamily enzyme